MKQDKFGWKNFKKIYRWDYILRLQIFKQIANLNKFIAPFNNHSLINES